MRVGSVTTLTFARNLAEPSGHRSGGSAGHLCRSPITDQTSGKDDGDGGVWHLADMATLPNVCFAPTGDIREMKEAANLKRP